MKHLALAGLALSVGLLVATPVSSGGWTVVPSALNPGNAPVMITALWSPDPDAPSQHALTLAISEMVTFPPGASAIAAVGPSKA